MSAHAGDGGFDSAVDSRQRDVVRRGAGVLDDGGNKLARGLGLLFDFGVFCLKDAQALRKGRFIRRRFHFGNDHLAQRERAFKRSHVRARQVPISRDIFVCELVEQMTDAARHQH
jgi:hypothetical protein